MTPYLSRLQPYPFERLAAIRQSVTPAKNKKAIDLSIGEPRHPTPSFIKNKLVDQLDSIAAYPSTRGTDGLRTAIRGWLCQRFGLPDDTITAEDNVLPVNGTREALFAIAQCVVDQSKPDPVVISPNPFYQIYEGAALLAGAKPFYLNCTKKNGYLPDFDEVPAEIWERCQLIYICSPGNPTGAVLGQKELVKLLKLSDKYDFVIASDECYSEIYLDEGNPPPSLLQAAASSGRVDYRNCLVFHSLSKRSNVPGLRSGFVAGDKEVIRQFLLYRTYHGCAMPLPTQSASVAAWKDELHVVSNRRQYHEKFESVLEILQPVLYVDKPAAGFYLWPEVPIDDVKFATDLLKTQNVTVLPGSFLARSREGLNDGDNPGQNRVRIALVSTLDEAVESAHRIKEFIETI